MNKKSELSAVIPSTKGIEKKWVFYNIDIFPLSKR